MSMLDDDEEMEWWLSLTDSERDAIVDREMERHNRWYDSLTHDQKVSYCVQGCLDNCKNYRKLYREWPEMDLFRDYLRECQVRLLKLRTWRQTGIYPGSA